MTSVRGIQTVVVSGPGVVSEAYQTGPAGATGPTGPAGNRARVRAVATEARHWAGVLVGR